MTAPSTCPTCGAPLPSDATGGACPKCLLQAGFASAFADGGGATSSPPSGDHVPTPAELAPKFPNLEIGELLGRGGMGVVYRARHKALDRDVALKVLPERVAADRAFADRFQREARALAKLQHPNIVGVHDFGLTDGLFWLVMEYVDGANIRQAMRAGQIGPREALAIVPQICDALQYAHERGVVHRDIKPENVLLDRAGRVKVADFGLAKLMEHGPADPTLTGAGQVMGTPHYMAPEQWEKPTTVDHRADIYSLGVVFYEMLTGELPLGRFAAPSGKCDVDARIDEIVLRTLEKEREARYQHVLDVKTDMGRLPTEASAKAGASGPFAPPATAVAAPAPIPASSRRWKWGVGVTTIAGIVSLVWGLLPGGEPGARLWIGGFGFVVCLVQILDWRVRRAHPQETDDHRRMAWLIGSSAVCVGLAVTLANTLDTAVMRHAAGTLALLIAAFFGVEMWKLRRERRPASAEAPRPTNVLAWVVIAFLVVPVLVVVVFAITSAGTVTPPAGKFDTSSDGFSEIGTKWKRFVALGPDATLDQILALYDHADRARLAAMPASERADAARRGELGLPLMPVDRLRPMSEFHFEGASFAGPQPPMRATASIVSDRTRIKFPMSRSFPDGGKNGRLSKWDFAVGQVEVETLPDAPPPPRPDFDAVDEKGGPASISDAERARISDLWTRAQRLPGLAASVEEAGDLYPAVERATLAARIAVARAGDLGLPLILRDHLPANFHLFRLERVVFGAVVQPAAASGPMTARAMATNGEHDVWFDLRRDFVGTAAKSAFDEWFFATTPVVVAKRMKLSSAADVAAESAALLAALRQAKSPRTAGTTKDLYVEPFRLMSISFTGSRDGWSVPGKDGKVGLPLTSDATLGGRLSDYWIDAVEPSADHAHAVVTIVHVRAKLGVAFEIARDKAGAWRFTTKPVEWR